jgi:RNA polymerase sigma-70 factor (ECF subfamily)
LQSDHETSRTESLLRAASLGDRSALSELIGMHRDYLRRVIDVRMDPALRGRVDPSDIVQETQMVASNRLDDFVQRRPISFKLWLRGEAIQQIGAQYRRHVKADRRSVQRECSISDASSMMLAKGLLAGTPSKVEARKEMAAQVRELLETLPDIDREILLLRYVEQLSNAEAAELLSIDPATARKRHGRALKRLLKLMIESGLAIPDSESRP